MGYIARKRDDPFKTDPGWAWGAMILRELDNANLHDDIDFRSPIVDSATVRWITGLGTFVCPSDRATGVFNLTD